MNGPSISLNRPGSLGPDMMTLWMGGECVSIVGESFQVCVDKSLIRGIDYE